MSFESIGEMILSVCEILQPAEKFTVAEAAEEYRYVNQPGAYVGWWYNKTTPMLVEPMNTFTSRKYFGMIFCGPAQSGKTDALILNTVAYSVKCEPMDMMIVCPTQTAGRDFSIRRLDRLHRHSEKIGEMQLSGSDNDNKFDKHYRNGMLLTISWPTPTELAGKPIGRIVMTDYDRMPDDVGGDGNPYDLASQRTTTFGSYAMTLAESSPSREVTNLTWIPQGHEAPPAGGILELYNRGDKRRWYWPCPKCGEYFEGKFEHLVYTRAGKTTNLEIAETVMMRCPCCTEEIHPDERDGMQLRGRWVKDGQGIDKDGIVFGPEPRTTIASFWLRGVAAAFKSWKKLVTGFLDATDTYDRTGSEDALRKFYNNDLAEPYYPKRQQDIRLPENLKARAEQVEEKNIRKVPAGVRFLVALIDVQKNMFVVSVFGICPGSPFDTVIVDRFDVRKSKRKDHDGDTLWVKPNTYLEDWDELIENVMNKEYELSDDSGRLMAIKFTACDSGGEEGATARAYDFYRSLMERNLHRRFMLLKGDHSPKPMPRTRIERPDSNDRGKKAIARGDVPVLMLASNQLKDDLDGRLDCIEPGKGMYRIPSFMEDNVYSELCSEVRTPKGWEKPPGKKRNEQWDLSYYCIGLCISQCININGINWKNPPGWAAEWDKNDLVREANQEPSFTNTIKSRYDFGELATTLA